MLLSGHRYLGSPDPGHTHQSPDVRRIQTGNDDDEPWSDVARDAEMMRILTNVLLVRNQHPDSTL